MSTARYFKLVPLAPSSINLSDQYVASTSQYFDEIEELTKEIIRGRKRFDDLRPISVALIGQTYYCASNQNYLLLVAKYLENKGYLKYIYGRKRGAIPCKVGTTFNGERASGKEVNVYGTGTNTVFTEDNVEDIDNAKYMYLEVGGTVRPRRPVEIQYMVPESADRNTTWLRPSQIRFTQDSIGKCFRNGESVNGLIEDNLSGTTNINDIPLIEVAKENGYYYSSDNRRLYVFRALEKMGVLDKIEVQLIRSIPNRKKTSNNAGDGIRMRSGEKAFPHTFKSVGLQQETRTSVVGRQEEQHPPKRSLFSTCCKALMYLFALFAIVAMCIAMYWEAARQKNST